MHIVYDVDEVGSPDATTSSTILKPRRSSLGSSASSIDRISFDRSSSQAGTVEYTQPSTASHIPQGEQSIAAPGAHWPAPSQASSIVQTLESKSHGVPAVMFVVSTQAPALHAPVAHPFGSAQGAELSGCSHVPAPSQTSSVQTS